ncbi:hypothetical protein SLA2020_072430 [Shorea laevis]
MPEWRDIDDLRKNAANYTALTTLWFLERAATVHPTKKSLVHGSLTYTSRQTIITIEFPLPPSLSFIKSSQRAPSFNPRQYAKITRGILSIFARSDEAIDEHQC